MNRNIYGLNHGEQEYFINGVRYLVSSRFESVEAEKKVTILDRIKKIMKSFSICCGMRPRTLLQLPEI